MESSRKTPWCSCECHTNENVKHVAACCCSHGIKTTWDCPDCCSLPRNSDGSCEKHNHHSGYNKAWGLEWTGVVEEDTGDESLEEHIRSMREQYYELRQKYEDTRENTD